MATVETTQRPETLAELLNDGWQSKSVKQELYDNFVKKLATGADLFPGILGYENTVIPEINLAILSGHDILLLGEKGQAKSRLMRNLIQFLDPYVPYLAIPNAPFHEDPFNPITSAAKRFVADHDPQDVPLYGLLCQESAPSSSRLIPGFFGSPFSLEREKTLFHAPGRVNA